MENIGKNIFQNYDCPGSAKKSIFYNQDNVGIAKKDFRDIFGDFSEDVEWTELCHMCVPEVRTDLHSHSQCQDSE